MEETLKQILEQLRSLNSRVSSMDSEIKGINNKLNNLETEVKEGFLSVNERIDKLEKKEKSHFELVMDEQGKIFNSLDGKLDIVSEQLKGYNIRISALEV